MWGKCSKLRSGKHAPIGHGVMLHAESDHPVGLVMVSLVPWRIKVVPCQKRLPAIWNRATEAHLFAQNPLGFLWRIPVDSRLVFIHDLPFLV